MKRIVYSVMFLAGSIIFMASCGERPATSDRRAEMPEVAEEVASSNLINAMISSVNEMRELELTGDPDYDFANLFARHREGGIALAEEQIDNGQDVALVEYAERVQRRNEQEKEILEEFTSEYTPETQNEAFTNEVNRLIDLRESEISHLDLTGDEDQDFARAMATHHEHGLRLARLYQNYGRVQELRSMADEMVEIQESELRSLSRYIQQQEEEDV
ncbi:MAG: DUF305 domain-containing protein [Cytophagaceae bacterium]